jgi:hypothetical protein
MHALAAVRREIVSRDTSGGRKYLREYTQAYRHYDAILSSQQLQETIVGADILLVGDYHALPASQRYPAALIEHIAAQRPIVLGVEAVLSRDQPILDSWWRREIGEAELRRRLRFDHDWGYTWEPFSDLLAAARDHAEGIYGLDCMPRADMRRIRSRDRHAVAKLMEVRQGHPGAAILVLFGESHMAPEHLPRIVKQALPGEKVLTVLQNVDALYWQAVNENAVAVSAGRDAVCVFNASPLEKYESYRLCLERWHSDDQADFAPAIYNLIFSLARTLGFRLDSPGNGTQPKYLADCLPEVVTLGESSSPWPALEDRGCVYVPETNTLLIREFRMPHAAAEAARFLYHACRGFSANPGSPREDLEAQAALAHFGSRLLCPESQPDNNFNAKGEELYRAYIAGRWSRAAIRRMFGCR